MCQPGQPSSAAASTARATATAASSIPIPQTSPAVASTNAHVTPENYGNRVILEQDDRDQTRDGTVSPMDSNSSNNNSYNSNCKQPTTVQSAASLCSMMTETTTSTTTNVDEQEDQQQQMSSQKENLQVNVDDDDCNDDVDTNNSTDDETEMSLQRRIQEARATLHRGTMLGGMSLGLLFVANSLTMPYQQSKRDALHCDTMCIGSLSSSKSTLRLVGATILGRLSDTPTTAAAPSSSSRHVSTSVDARRVCLWLGIGATMISLYFENRASSMEQLRYSMIPGGLLEQNSHILKALFGDYHSHVPGPGTTPGERASSNGIIGMSMGLAMMFGPLIGSTLLSTYDQATKCAIGLLIMAAILVAMLPSPTSIPETTGSSTSASSKVTATTTTVTMKESEVSAQQQRQPGSTAAISFAENRKVLLRKMSSSFNIFDVPSARSSAGLFLLAFRLLSALSYHIYQTILITSLRERFHFSKREYGIFFSIIGMFFALSQGYVAKFLLDRFGTTPQRRSQLLTVCTFLIGAQRFMAFYTTNLIMVYVMFAIMVVAYGVTSTIFAADTTQVASPKELGAFFGLVAAVENGAGMVGPLLGGSLALYWHPTKAPLLASVSLSVVGAVLLSQYYEKVVLGHIRVTTPTKSKAD